MGARKSTIRAKWFLGAFVVCALALLVGTLLAVAVASATIQPQGGDEFEVDGIKYMVSYTADDEASVVSGLIQGEYTIPETVTYGEEDFRVTWVRGEILGNNPGLTKLVLPKTVCDITSPTTLDVDNFTEIEVSPDNEYFTSVNGMLFSKDGEILVFCPGGKKDVVIPGDTKVIPVSAFQDNTALESVVLEEGVQRVEEAAFNGCVSLIAVELPSTLAWLGYDAFAGCTSLTAFEVPEGIVDIPGGMFYGCTALEEVSLSSSVQRIGALAFAHCDAIDAIDLAEGITSIEERAFAGTEVTSVNIPSTLVSFTAESFAGADKLTNFTTEEQNDTYQAVDGVVYDASLKTMVVYPVSRDDEAYELLDGIESIRAYAFEGAENLTTITVPNTVTAVGDAAFYGTGNLEDILIKQALAEAGTLQRGSLAPQPSSAFVVDGTLYVGQEAVYHAPMSPAAHIRIPDGITKVQRNAFAAANNVTSMTIPASMLLLDGEVFSGESLADVYFLGTVPPEVTDYSDSENPRTSAFSTMAGNARMHIEDGISAKDRNAFLDSSRFGIPAVAEDLASVDSAYIEEGVQ